MKKEEYLSDNDYNGARGIAIADYNLLVKKRNKKASPLEILSNTNPKILTNFSDGTVFDGIFRKLKKAGYEVKDYSIMDGPQKWNYYLSLMKEFNLLSKRD
jgi:hypothetical protein